MKIAVVYPENQAWPKYWWVVKALRSLGHEATPIHSLDELRSADEVSDLVIFGHYSAGLTMVDVVKLAETKKAFWCQWWFDLIRTNPRASYSLVDMFFVHRKFIELMDLVLVKERDGLGELRKIGINAHYMDQGVPTDLPQIPWVERPKYDCVLWGKCGSNYWQRREDISFLVSKGMKVLWAGCVDEEAPRGVNRQEFVPPYELAEFASQGRCIVNVDCTKVDGFTSDRTWLSLMIGGATVIRDGNNLPWAPMLTYGTNESLLRHVELICGANDYRRELGKRAREWAMENVSVEKRCKEVLELCQKRMSQKTL